jgi:predicted ATP-grasp superfamily ATP-dependent carboligase
MSITFVLQSLDSSLGRIESAIRLKSESHAAEVIELREQLTECQAQCKSLEEKVDYAAERIEKITERLQKMVG